MFDRLVYGSSAPLITIVAFATASLVFVAFSLRALRMRRRETDRFANLPFETDTPPARNEPSDTHAPDA